VRSTISRGRGLRAAAAGVAAAAVLSGCAGATELPVRELPVPAALTRAADVQTAAAAPAHVAPPVRVRVPAIGVDAAVGALDVDAQGVLPPPATNHETGWWRAGPEPGEAGPAVIVGHVDSRQGPAVFFRLRQLVAGDRILVDRADGTTAEFVVERSERFGKDSFPTEAVYGATPNPQLRLITCGGRFDRSTRHYVDNVVVFARSV
jgi:sortase (surface protein transpeptidase)